MAPQALALMNGKFAVGSSSELARRLQRDVGADPRAQIRRLFELALGRRPTEREREAYLSTLEQHRSRFAQEARQADAANHTESSRDASKTTERDSPEIRALADLCLVTLNTNEFLYLD